MKLEADNIYVQFGTQEVLKNIYVRAQSGKITSVIGSNGCGKTTLFKSIFGVQYCKTKLIRINDNPIKKALYKTGRVQYLPQHHLLPNYYKIGTALKMYGIIPDEFISLFPEYKLSHNIKVKYLSGGQRRFLEVYLVLQSKAHFILLDEPFTGVDPLHIEKIIELIESKKNQKSMLISDHYYNEIKRITDETYLLQGGNSYHIKDEQDLERFGYLHLERFKNDLKG